MSVLQDMSACYLTPGHHLRLARHSGPPPPLGIPFWLATPARYTIPACQHAWYSIPVRHPARNAIPARMPSQRRCRSHMAGQLRPPRAACPAVRHLSRCVRRLRTSRPVLFVPYTARCSSALSSGSIRVISGTLPARRSTRRGGSPTGTPPAPPGRARGTHPIRGDPRASPTPPPRQLCLALRSAARADRQRQIPVVTSPRRCVTSPSQCVTSPVGHARRNVRYVAMPAQ